MAEAAAAATEAKEEAASRKAKIDYFNELKEAYRSMRYAGEAKVTDTRRVPERLKEELNPQEENLDEVMEDAEAAVDRVMEDPEAAVDQAMQGEENEVEEKSVDLKKSEDTKIESKEVIAAINSPKLHEGSYIMGPTTLRCLIWKVHNIDPKAFNTFALLEAVRHPAIVRHHTFYEEAFEPRVVLSWVDGSLWDLIADDKASKRFFRSTKSGISFGPELQTMILDICRGLNHLFELDLYPPKLDLDDLYVCKDGPKNHRVQLLILEVEKLASQRAKMSRKTALWTQVRSIINDIREITDTDEFSEVAKCFINYISRDVAMLAHYPLSWSYDQKGGYLMSIISADKSFICGLLEGSGLKWPKGDDALGFPKILTVLIEHDRKRDHPSNYSTAKPYDYLKLSRTAFKHFPDLSKQVPAFQDMFRTRQDFLEKMEKWEPLIWCILYNAIGRIASQ